jgi:hypothetical protein
MAIWIAMYYDFAMAIALPWAEIRLRPALRKQDWALRYLSFAEWNAVMTDG